MDESTLKKLQFDSVTAILGGLCATRLGQQGARRLLPSSDDKVVRHQLFLVRELMDLQPSRQVPPLAGAWDIRTEVRDTGTPKGVDAEALSRIQGTLAALGQLRRWLLELPEQSAIKADYQARVHDFGELTRQIGLAVDSRGAVRDDASEKLSQLRGLIEEHKRRIRRVFERILKERRYLKMLQYPSMTFHDDRYVLPLKAEYRGRIPGIIHRSSRTGSTIFVEPSEAVQLNNATIRLRLKEEAEVARIIGELSRQVHRHEAQILQSLEAAGALDLLAAKVSYARHYRAICPQINDRRVLDIHEARHPVLLELCVDEATAVTVVPIDIRVGDDFDILVITGPNTGGKTVAMKTVGLFAAMTQAGIPIPAAPGSTLCVYERIFIDVGDEQSLEQSLSTFSGHLSNILTTLRQADNSSLVLLDELGAGTDPDEGAAIGEAVLDELRSIGCAAVITTHLSVLKGAAYAQPRVDNASVEFDVRTLEPTYHLRIGEPGNSNAITIAERLGMPQRMIACARKHLQGRERALSQAIEGTLQSRRQAETARKDAVQARQQALRAREQMEEKTQALERARADFLAWQAWVNHLKPGDAVYVRTLDKNATVVRMQLHKQQAVVSRGAVDYEVQLSALARPRDD